MEYEIKTGDCIDVMKTMPDECVDTIITSPPYWGLRDYGGGGKVWGGDPECNHEWEGYTRPSENTRNNDNSLQLKSAYWEPQEQAFCEHCDAWFGQLGLEPNPEQYVKNMVEVFREARRILKPEGTLWLNLGDSYVGGGRGFQYSKEGTIQKSYIDAGVRYGAPTGKVEGLKPKDLVGIPWRVAFALQADGWWLRQDIIWAKPNCMPESVTDRCTKNHEYVFMLTKSKQYYFDHEAIKEPTKGGASTKRPAKEQTFRYGDDDSWAVKGDRDRIMKAKGIAEARTKDYAKRNKRSVWWVGPKPFKEAHFAVFPIELIEPMVLAGSSAKGCCADCGSPYERVVERTSVVFRPSERQETKRAMGVGSTATALHGTMIEPPTSKTVGWQPTCECHGKLVMREVVIPAEMTPEQIKETTWAANSNGEYNGSAVKDYESVNGEGKPNVQNASDVKRRIIENKTKDRVKKMLVYESDLPLDEHPIVPSVVFDPFGGSGTTVVTALKHGRKAIISELNEDYVEIARNRIEGFRREVGIDKTNVEWL